MDPRATFAARYAASMALVAAMTGVIAVVREIADVENVSMLYLLAVLGAAVAFGSGPAIAAAVASFVAFNFFFISPHYTFRVGDDDQWVALGLLLVTGAITGQLAATLRQRAVEAERREKEAVVLFDVARLMTHAALEDSLTAIADRLKNELAIDAVLVLLREGDSLNERAASGSPAALDLAREAGPGRILASGDLPTGESRGRTGRWVRVVQPAKSARTASAQRGRVRSVPVSVGGATVGALVTVLPADAPGFTAANDRLLAAVASQIGIAIERLRLQREAVNTEVLRRTDEMRAALLNAVSHDLRTPLSSIIASAGSMLQEDVHWTDEERRAFGESIVEEAQRLDRLVGNLLDLSRVEAGAIKPEKAWYDLPSLIRDVVARARRTFPDSAIALDLPAEAPPVLCDYVEIEQVLTNLVENALRHGAGEVRVSLRFDREDAFVEVADNGPGIPPESMADLFTPFHRLTDSRTAGEGAGLGLAVAKGFVTAHAGRIWAENRPGGGAAFGFTLPVDGRTPAVV